MRKDKMENFEILPTEENLIKTLEADLLGRNQQLSYFYNLLLAQKGASTIAVDGKWGSGKTFFIKQSTMVINAKNPVSIIEKEKREKILSKLFLTESDNYDDCNLAIYYDAWENDNDTDPIVSLVYEIAKQLGMTYTFDPDTDFFKLGGAVLDVFSGKNLKGIIENLKSDNPLSKFKEQKALEEKLKDFFSEALNERGNRLVVFIDELDRCKPSFTVRLLEQIKHYMHDERITYVLSINTEELQHTIKNYYGDSFDACRYLDRFFYLRINLPPVDKKKFYMNIELNGMYYLEIISRRIIDVYNMQLREITRFYRQVRTAAYVPTHDDEKWNCIFPDGEARQFMLSCIVPIIIGLKMVDISMYEQFISGESGKPMVDILNTKEFSTGLLCRFLKEDESFSQIEKKKLITPEEKILEIYNAIFVNKYSGNDYQKTIGKCEFDADSRKFVLVVASMLSQYANYEI